MLGSSGCNRPAPSHVTAGSLALFHNLLLRRLFLCAGDCFGRWSLRRPCLPQPPRHRDPGHPEEASKDDEQDEKVEGKHVETEILHKVEIKVIDPEVVEVAILDEQLQPEDSLLKALPSHVSPHSGKSGQIFSGGKMQ